MIASDLRIGNWVHDGSNFPMQVVGIFEDVVYLDFEGNEGDVWECGLEGPKPFELTEEWLEKFGLIHELSRYDDYWYLLGSDWFGIEFDEESNKWFCILLSGKRSIAEFKHVHELQNLVHALTGEEL